MTFENEKFLSSWYALFCVYLVSVNAKLFPNFLWTEFFVVGTILGLLSWLIFRKATRPNIRFYIWGLFYWGLLLIILSSFSLLLLGRTFGGAWLWLLTPLWVISIGMFIRRWVHLEDGVSSTKSGTTYWISVVGASMSGAVTFYVSKATFSFILAVVLDVALSYFVTLFFTLWLRRYLKLRRGELAMSQRP